MWVSAFVAQRLGMERVGPFAFEFSRFAVGSLTPILVPGWPQLRTLSSSKLSSGLLLGFLLFVAASPTHAAIILSLESVFTALSGWLALGRPLAATTGAMWAYVSRNAARAST